MKKTNGSQEAAADKRTMLVTSYVIQKPIVVVEYPVKGNYSSYPQLSMIMHHMGKGKAWDLVRRCDESMIEYKEMPLFVHYDGKHYKALTYVKQASELPKLTKKFKV